MRHRLEPRGGAYNEQPDLLEESEDMAAHDQGCTLPPPGWWCSREPGHDNPCAARPICGHDQFTFSNCLPVPCPCVMGPDVSCTGTLLFDCQNVKKTGAFLICSECACAYFVDNSQRKERP
jgi:hypothetical protein